MPSKAMSLKFTSQLAQSLFQHGAQMMSEDLEEDASLQAISELEQALEQLSLAKSIVQEGSPHVNGLIDLEEKASAIPSS